MGAAAAKPAPKRGRPPKDPSEKASTPPKPKLWELSVTISAGSCDIEQSTLDHMKTFLNERCEAGLFAFERGGSLAHRHIQGVIRVMCTGGKNMNTEIRKFLGWDKNKPSVGASVMCKALTQTKVHTWHGMIGYCQKDTGEEHFKEVYHNISADDMSLGAEQYLRHGAGPLKNRIMLEPKRTFDKAMIYYNMYCRTNPRVDIETCLLMMLRTGKYYPAAEWVIPHTGQGWDRVRAAIAWRMLIHPEQTTLDDVHCVFGQRIYRYWEKVPDLTQVNITGPLADNLPAGTMVDNRANAQGDVHFVDEPEDVRVDPVPVVVDHAPAKRVLRTSFAKRFTAK